ncbi:MAG: hypothetical protein E7582_06530 [Ruminococcaceae bacterium]|nr:hypothetical protein [Oscillospiraceae bacterium]
MNKLRYKLQSFMTGRYGPDEFYYFLLIVYTVLLILNCFIGSPGIHIAIWVILIYSLYRVFSKNIARRQKENAKFLMAKYKIKTKFSKFKNRIKDREHVYKKCPHCKATLRFPRRRGKHDAICPKCRRNLKVRVYF